jgi:hypothetical protein
LNPLFNRFNRIAVINTMMIALSFQSEFVLLIKIPQKALAFMHFRNIDPDSDRQHILMSGFTLQFFPYSCFPEPYIQS